MRILMVNANGSIVGGADQVFLRSTQLLIERGHAVAWLIANPCEPGQQMDFPVYSLRNAPERGRLQARIHIIQGTFYSQRARNLLRRAIREFRPDVVHIHSLRGAFSPSILLDLKRNRVPVVQTLHDYGLICPVNTFMSAGRVCEFCKEKKHSHCWAKRCAGSSFRGGALFPSIIFGLGAYTNDYIYHYERLIDRFISPGKFLQQKMIEFGYPPEKMLILNNAYFGQTAQAGWGDRRGVLFVGRLSYEKGIDLLVRAVAGLDAPVLIVGDGPERASLEALAQEVRASNVRFLGFRPFEEVQRLYAGALISVLPSRWYENSPLVILEAYAQGTPVLGADIGAIPEFVQDGRTGYLFRSGDADDLRAVLSRCLNDKAALQSLGQNARRYVMENHSPEKYAEGLEEILRSVSHVA